MNVRVRIHVRAERNAHVHGGPPRCRTQRERQASIDPSHCIQEQISRARRIPLINIDRRILVHVPPRFVHLCQYSYSLSCHSRVAHACFKAMVSD